MDTSAWDRRDDLARPPVTYRPTWYVVIHHGTDGPSQSHGYVEVREARTDGPPPRGGQTLTVEGPYTLTVAEERVRQWEAGFRAYAMREP